MYTRSRLKKLKRPAMKKNNVIFLLLGGAIAVFIFKKYSVTSKKKVTMTAEQRNNIVLITEALKRFGITNKAIQAAVLATISKESNFIPKSENLNYTVANIKRVWPKTSDSDAARLANNPEALGNFKYGGKGGNLPNEGYKYRGRGFNQITFKGNYYKYGQMIGVDLVKNPDLLNDPKIAALAAAAFFSSELNAGIKAGSFKKFNVPSIDAIKDTTTATKVVVQINAGRGTNFNNGVVQEGYNRAKGIVDSLYSLIS